MVPYWYGTIPYYGMVPFHNFTYLFVEWFFHVSHANEVADTQQTQPLISDVQKDFWIAPTPYTICWNRTLLRWSRTKEHSLLEIESWKNQIHQRSWLAPFGCLHALPAGHGYQRLTPRPPDNGSSRPRPNCFIGKQTQMMTVVRQSSRKKTYDFWDEAKTLLFVQDVSWWHPNTSFTTTIVGRPFSFTPWAKRRTGRVTMLFVVLF